MRLKKVKYSFFICCHNGAHSYLAEIVFTKEDHQDQIPSNPKLELLYQNGTDSEAHYYTYDIRVSCRSCHFRSEFS